MTTTPRRVGSTDGVSLAVYESGDPLRPTLVAVHGYPDNHAVWDGAIDLLTQRFHVAAYDVRGTGESDKPDARRAYRMDQLIDDFTAVIDAVSPEAPVHVLAHDWGSIQCWAAVTDENLAGRIASFTSISGPSLDYSGAWLRDIRKHPRASLSQLAHSYYIALFQLPLLPELAVRRGLIDRLAGIGGRSAAAGVAAPRRSEADKINGLSLYRANMLGKLSRPRPVPTRIPVQVIVAEKDAFVTPALAIEAAQPWVPDLTTHTVPGGHWVISERPDVIARLTIEFVDSLAANSGPEPSRGGHRDGAS